MTNKNIDIFSHRTHSQYDGFSIQYNLVREELIRENYLRILSGSFNIKLNDNVVFDDVIKKIVSDYSCRDIFYNKSGEYCIKSIYNCFYFKKQTKKYDVEIQDDVICDNNEYFFEILTSSKEIYNNIEEKLVEYGFSIIHKFSSSNISVSFAFLSNNGEIRYSTHNLDRVDFQSVEQNYNNDVVTKTKKLLSQLENQQNGIVVVHGMQGTGKTYLLRSIITEMKNRRAVICSPPMSFINDAGKLEEITSNFNKSLIIFEDIGDLLTMDSSSYHIDARANLLNITDGLLSLVANCVILITFNTDIHKIDPAVIRPGRCLANIEVGTLSYEHSKKLVGDIIIPKREYTLAEIYQIKNGEDLNSLNEVKGKMGF